MQRSCCRTGVLPTSAPPSSRLVCLLLLLLLLLESLLSATSPLTETHENKKSDTRESAQVNQRALKGQRPRQEAVDDAKASIEQATDWPKAYCRLGQAFLARSNHLHLMCAAAGSRGCVSFCVN